MPSLVLLFVLVYNTSKYIFRVNSDPVSHIHHDEHPTGLRLLPCFLPPIESTAEIGLIDTGTYRQPPFASSTRVELSSLSRRSRPDMYSRTKTFVFKSITQLPKLSINHSIGRAHSWRICNNSLKYRKSTNAKNWVPLLGSYMSKNR